jgi:hypothetical protein
MASKLTLPDSKFSGADDRVGIQQYLRHFQLYVALNEWSDQKAGRYLSVFLTGDAEAFLYELCNEDPEKFKNSYAELSARLVQRYEGGLANLRYRREWQQRVRSREESLNSFLSDLRLLYTRAFPKPNVADIDGEELNKARLDGVTDAYNAIRDSAIKGQFINGLGSELRDILVCDDNLLEKPIDQILRRVASIEAEKSRVKPTFVAASSTQPDSSITENTADFHKLVEDEVQKCFVQAAGRYTPGRGAGRGGTRGRRGFGFRDRGGGSRGPKSDDLCNVCGGRGHWARRCPSN